MSEQLRARTLALLRRLERSEDYEDPFCPACDHRWFDGPDHAPDCELAALIRELAAGDPEE